MSTSPSWFDQDKFSRLVKKVGPKPTTSGAPLAAGTRLAPPNPPEKETRRLQRFLGGAGRAAPVIEPPPQGTEPEAADPSPIRSDPVPDTVIRAEPIEPGAEIQSPDSHFPPPMPLPEPRSVSPLARRTTPLPNMKPIFEYEKPAARDPSPSLPVPGRPHLTPLPPAEPVEETPAPATAESPGEPAQPEFTGLQETGELPVEWQTFPSLYEEPAKQAGTGSSELDQLVKERDDLSARVEELSRVAGERDDARAEAELLRAQLRQADEILQATSASGADSDELTRTMEERDGARRDYANLREAFEALKLEQSRSRSGPALDLSSFALKPEGSSKSAPSTGEIDALKSDLAGLENALAALKKEVDDAQSQLRKSRDETSIAQRGLALSQKALQETRDALRESGESSSQARANADTLKNESASLVQQNRALQSQNDQLSRQLTSVTGKLGGDS